MNDYKNIGLIERFTDAVKIYQSKKAVCCNEKSIAYLELDKLSNRVANWLIKNRITKNEIVSIALDRSPEIIVVILGILKSSAAYLPIDPRYPKDRITFMANDANSRFLITSQIFSNIFNINGKVTIYDDILLECLDDSSVSDIIHSNDDLAYILYTSGSTGNPKGAMVTHGNLLHFLQGMQDVFQIDSSYNFLSVSSISFDASCFDNYFSLLHGATLVIADNDTARDGQRLVNLIKDKAINILLATPATYKLMLQTGWRETLDLTILSAGEPLAKNLATELLKRCSRLYNVYGPTETTVICILTRIFENEDITIGKPITGTPIYILNENMQPVNDFEAGEIYIGGKGVSLGYLNRPELSAERFMEDPFNPGGRMYKSGDIGRWTPDGSIDYLGRTDYQVKIRGFRIELGEIEQQLRVQRDIKEAVVTTDENRAGEKRLIAYVTLTNDGLNKATVIAKIKDALKSVLPDFMIPEHIIILDEFPVNDNGKINRKSLPRLSLQRPDLRVLYKEPQTQTEKNIEEVWSQVLEIQNIGIDDNFFELGGNSLFAQKTISLLKEKYKYEIPIAKLYQHPTISGLQNFMNGKIKSKKQAPLYNNKANGNQAIAVIGMECKFPGAETIEKYWNVLQNGIETISFFTNAEIDSSVSEEIRNHPDYIKARGILRDVEFFDAHFFGIHPKLAEIMDPQHRIFLEVCRNLLEKTGYLPDKKDVVTGVFAGCNTNTYYNNNVAGYPDKIAIQGDFPVVSVTDKDYVASRVAYQLNLNGPAVNVNSACSTSLLAIAQAVQSLRTGQCHIAIAGGVAIHVPVKTGHTYNEGTMLSNDGHCRPFDAAAKGTVFSDGAGAVLLKPLPSAIEDGDTVYAVIKGIGVNNDGGDKGSFSAPSAVGQYGAISMAIKDAKIDPATITYVETHGTATPLGDPIEIEGLKMAFGNTSSKQYCAIGSVKSNMGHLTHAAGVAGFIKASLALHNKQIPPSIHYNSPNPAINFADSPFYVNNVLRSWDIADTRIAGVSSFGVGGTNVHVILEEYNSNGQSANDTEYTSQIFIWSAATKESVLAYGTLLKDFIETHRDISLAKIAYTLQATRQEFAYRIALVAKTVDDLLLQLTNTDLLHTSIQHVKSKPQNIVFTFPGQGSQYINMGKGLYESQTVFKQAIDECAEILNKVIGEDIRNIIFQKPDDENAILKLQNTYYTQPAIFTISYAMAQLYSHMGIVPNALKGHSIGEFVAAHFAGVFSLEDVLTVVAARAGLISKLETGCMLSVRADSNYIKKIIPDNIDIAAVNAPALCVLSGREIDIMQFASKLNDLQVPNKILRTSHAFHSYMMDSIVQPLEDAVKKASLYIPTIPVLSTVTANWLKDEEAQSPVYWSKHSRTCVNFSGAVQAIDDDLSPIFIEMGPGTSNTTLIKQHGSNIASRAFYTMGYSNIKTEDSAFKEALGKLWCVGVEINWSHLYTHKIKILHDVPTYAYQKKRHWLEPVSKLKNDELLSNFNSLNGHKTTTPNNMSRKNNLIKKIKDIIENASGIDIMTASPHDNFMELGLDSLLLTQIASAIKNECKVPVSFRQLNEEYNNLDALAGFIDAQLPQDVGVQDDNAQSMQNMPISLPNHQAYSNQEVSASSNNTQLSIISQQISLLAQQIALLQGNSAQIVSTQQSASISPTRYVSSINERAVDQLTPEEKAELTKPFGATAKIEKKAAELNTEQQKYLTKLIERYSQKTIKSKLYTQQHRAQMADPRVVSGFKPLTKEMVYSIVVNESKGCYLWDIDGNKYIDALNGFGSNFLGYQPDFLKQALISQIEKGYEIGPQHELAGEVSQLICEFTGFDRAALCNTGSEAVLGAMRIARTVTGRNIIVAFTGSYHGIMDEVLVRGTQKLKTYPAASGILADNVQNMLILEYGTEESLQIIQEKSAEIAAVLVEVVQSRRPEFQPVEFLKQLRTLATDKDIALIFDEVITGFRCHLGGVQALFNIKADLATYGKVVGGGMSIGVIAGYKKFMDALDGGYWQYGDTSIPEIGVTYFAGTFVRHPLALATAKATLQYLKKQGQALQESLNEKTTMLSEQLNSICKNYGIPLYIAYFSSLWKIKFKEEYHYHELLFALMRLKGIHIWDGFPCFLTTAHTDDDLKKIVQAFDESVHELCEAGFIPQISAFQEEINYIEMDNTNPPIAGAKLGRDAIGNAAWFIEDKNNPGNYLQIIEK